MNPLLGCVYVDNRCLGALLKNPPSRTSHELRSTGDVEAETILLAESGEDFAADGFHGLDIIGRCRPRPDCRLEPKIVIHGLEPLSLIEHIFTRNQKDLAHIEIRLQGRQKIRNGLPGHKIDQNCFAHIVSYLLDDLKVVKGQHP